SGDIDVAALVKGLANVSKGTGESVVSPAELQKSVASVQKFVRTAHADVYVGQDDKELHRLAVKVDGVTDASTKSSSGIDGFNLSPDVSSTPPDSPSVDVPSDVAPLSQLQQDLGGLLGGLGGGSLGGA